jgi:hypothetical protein
MRYGLNREQIDKKHGAMSDGGAAGVFLCMYVPSGRLAFAAKRNHWITKLAHVLAKIASNS